MYWIADVSVHVKELRTLFYQRGSGARGVVFTSLLALLAAVLQSMGNFFPGIGYVLSALSTMPIVLLCCMLSIRYGCLGYLAAFFLLLIIQPGEAFVFPFTTGLLGIGLGSAFQFLKKRIGIVVSGAVFLWAGIIVLLYGVGFPVLGPAVSSHYEPRTMLFIFFFTCVYSWLWTDFSLFLIRTMVKGRDHRKK